MKKNKIQKNYPRKKSLFFYLDKDSVLEGQARIEGKVSLKGSIYGQLVCEGFYLKTASGVFENNLLDAILDSSKISPYFCSSKLFNPQNASKIIQWLP